MVRRVGRWVVVVVVIGLVNGVAVAALLSLLLWLLLLIGVIGVGAVLVVVRAWRGRCARVPSHRDGLTDIVAVVRVSRRLWLLVVVLRLVPRVVRSRNSRKSAVRCRCPQSLGGRHRLGPRTRSRCLWRRCGRSNGKVVG